MGTIVAFENVSLDGVTQDPTAEEGFGSEDWRSGLSPSDHARWDRLVLDDALGAGALLLGRRSYEFFAARYPQRAGALADRINRLPKYVISTTLRNPDWQNSTVLGGCVEDEVCKLRDSVDGEIRVYASSQLMHTLIDLDLVDELRLMVFPLVLGAGDRLFDQSTRPKHLLLAHTRTVGEGLAYLTYRRRSDT